MCVCVCIYIHTYILYIIPINMPIILSRSLVKKSSESKIHVGALSVYIYCAADCDVILL